MTTVKACIKKGGNGSPKGKSMPRPHKTSCGQSYAIKDMADRHDKQYHSEAKR